MKIVKHARVAAATANEYVRQALAFFGPTGATEDTPLATAVTSSDAEGDATFGRTQHATLVADVDANGATALQAYPQRVRLQLQNLHDTEPLEYDFGTAVVLGTGYVLDPKGVLVLSGDGCPADELRVAAVNAGRFKATDW